VWFSTVWVRVYNGFGVDDPHARELRIVKEILETVDDEDLAMRILTGTDNLPWYQRLTSIDV
jgi:hypothetical protein